MGPDSQTIAANACSELSSSLKGLSIEAGGDNAVKVQPEV
jgi:hypothetical protein